MVEQPTASTQLDELSETEIAAFNDLKASVPDLILTAAYSELYGHDISVASSPVTDKLLLNFLVAKKFAVQEAHDQLLETLKWRKEFNPLSAGFAEQHDAKFDGLGFITEDKSSTTGKPGEIITWNLYGQAAGKPEVVFGDTASFLRWRVGIMERGLRLLDFASDRVQISQVHDYANVSFLRMDPNAKRASREAVAIFQKYYPELLGKKYFVNVPLVMGWVFTAMKLFVSRETISKFVVLSYATYLVDYVGDWIPETYGGKGESLKIQDLFATITAPESIPLPDAVQAEPEVSESTQDDADAKAD
ncbi:CRAL-TRIO domain-containing protein [Lipomyces japonicus]|uniref:CRAL-TRIO domain-containing protein n=1 Tax=Lipomyces japonicus TaxID=56871 RepID=UPI0034CD349C